MTLTPALDLLLALVCLALAVWAARAANDFLFTGFLWVTAAATVGTLRLSGQTALAPVHDWLSLVSRGPGTLALGLGVLSRIYGPWPGQRWAASAVAVLGAALVYGLATVPQPATSQAGTARLDTFNFLLGLVLLAALTLAAATALRNGRPRAAAAPLIALALLLFIAFGLGRLTFPSDAPLQRVDVLHLLLTACYPLVAAAALAWRCSMGQMGAGRTTADPTAAE